MRIMSSPRSVDIAITNRCNLRCKYCSHFSSANDVEDDLTTDEWLSFFEELGELGVMTIVLQGGEPFCRPDLQQIINGIVNNHMRYSILSNGTLISEETCEHISRTERCNAVQVSIDGSNAKVHDSFRGEGSFVKAINGITCLKKYDIPVKVRVTIHRKNVHDLKNIASLLLNDLGLESFSTNSASYMGLCRSNVESIQLTPSERTLAMETLLNLKHKYNGRIKGQAGPIAEGEHWLRMVENQRKDTTPSQHSGSLNGCGGVFSKLAIRSDGVITPCSQMGHFELGRINEVRLVDIWLNHIELIKLRERTSIPLSEFEYCRDCDYVNYCSGDCPAIAYNLVGDEYKPCPESCLKKFLEQGGKLPRMYSNSEKINV